MWETAETTHDVAMSLGVREMRLTEASTEQHATFLVGEML